MVTHDAYRYFVKRKSIRSATLERRKLEQEPEKVFFFCRSYNVMLQCSCNKVQASRTPRVCSRRYAERKRFRQPLTVCASLAWEKKLASFKWFLSTVDEVQSKHNSVYTYKKEEKVVMDVVMCCRNVRATLQGQLRQRLRSIRHDTPVEQIRFVIVKHEAVVHNDMHRGK